jgi:DNA-binding NarL/FixJ family response regulator
LACQLAQGLRLEDAAENGQVSLNTMRTHLRRIFCKTGTDRQADLVRLILSGPAQMVRPVLSDVVASARKLRVLAAT